MGVSQAPHWTVVYTFSPFVETEEYFEGKSICVVIDVYLGHIATLDPEIIHFLALLNVCPGFI